MGKIFVIMGRSASGKDTIVNNLLNNTSPDKPIRIIQSTTRPIRPGEINGSTYFYRSKDYLLQQMKQKNIIECRQYDTTQGIWYYFTENTCIDLDNHSYIVIGTPESLKKFINHFGRDKIISILITVPEHNLLTRSIERESISDAPDYREVCRRFIADSEDFDENALPHDLIDYVEENINFNQCLGHVMKHIRKNM